jgi:hypothetical protein
MTHRKHEIAQLVRELAGNWKGALIGVTLFMLLWLTVFFCAFMITFGNETSWTGAVLRIIELFFVVANPLWGIPAALILGAVVIDRT